MYKKNILFLLVLGLVGCATEESLAKNPLQIKSFVKIYKHIKIEECNNPKDDLCTVGEFVATGSGIAVKNIKGHALILTAGHMCAKKFNENFAMKVKKAQVWLEVENYTGKKYRAKIINATLEAKDPRDLCTLITPKMKIKYSKLASQAPRPGDKVFAMSAISGVYHPPTVPIFRGIYAGLMPDKLNAMTTVPAKGGSSGSGILNSKGEVIGILFAVNRAIDHVSICSSWVETHKFVADSLKKIKDIQRKDDTSKL